MFKKIISGGQTGVDRAALDASLDHHFPCGGFCPKGRKAEDGRIPNRYPLQEYESVNYAERTRKNVLTADATLILYSKQLKGGTALTLRFCKGKQKPFLLIDASETTSLEAVKAILGFILEHAIDVLNVAGPRKSQWPSGYHYTYQCIEKLFNKL